MNMATALISLALAAIVGLVIWKMVKDKKKGVSSCGCDCGSCPMSGSCHQPEKKDT